MAQVVVTEAYLSDIAQALRVKLGTNETFKPSQMGNGVRRLPSASSAPVLIAKNISANGTYNASSDNADGYSSVVANVPNTYAAGDEGKVVSNGQLVAQTARSSQITENGTYDTTMNNEVVVSVSGGGGTSAIEEWDLTNSLIGTKRGWALTTGNVVLGNNGAIFDTTSDYLKLNLPLAITIELDIVSMSLQSGDHRRFIMGTDGDGFIYRSNGKWAFYSGNWVESNITDGNYFNNCTIKVIIDADGYWHIYKDGVLVWEPSLRLRPTNSIMVGSNGGQSINNAVISAIRVY